MIYVSVTNLTLTDEPPIPAELHEMGYNRFRLEMYGKKYEHWQDSAIEVLDRDSRTRRGTVTSVRYGTPTLLFVAADADWIWTRP